MKSIFKAFIFSIAVASMFPPEIFAATGGKVKESEEHWKYTVYLHGDLSSCTGVIIAQDAILTAAHCIRPSNPSYKLHEAWFGRPLDSIKNQKMEWITKLRLDDARIMHGIDLAVVMLRNPIPSGFYPISIFDDESSLRFGTKAILLGYGAPTVSSPLTLRRSRVKVRTPDSRSDTEIVFETSRRNEINRGDSGGPAVIAVGEKFELLGTAKSFSTTRNKAYYAKVIGLDNWLRQMIEEMRSKH